MPELGRVDTILTDPPYGLNFMGKKWDYDVPNIETWQECLRVLKPGGTALIFAGSRTQHRMACNVEDAGFILKDCIMWIYGSGFPKATDISKQLDKKGEFNITKSKTPEAQLWNGWKSHGLKPAYEPILVCMKPNEGSYADNALKWGVSGLNIDGGRIESNDKLSGGINSGSAGIWTNKKIRPIEYKQPAGRYPANIILDEEAARLLDEQSGELTSGAMKKPYKYTNTGYSLGSSAGKTKQIHVSNQGGASRFFYCAKASKSERNAGLFGNKKQRDESRSHGQAGTDNPYNRGAQEVTNHHPTVKPLKLIEYLCKLTETPTKGIVLDCFSGSGTLGIACERINRKYILIEKEEAYCEIAKKRIIKKLSQKRLPGF